VAYDPIKKCRGCKVYREHASLRKSWDRLVICVGGMSEDLKDSVR